MTTVAIAPDLDENGQPIYRAIAGDRQTIGKTAGEALDALTAELQDGLAFPLVIQSFLPDGYFSAVQQQRLTELMALWRTARDQGQTLPLHLQSELD